VRSAKQYATLFNSGLKNIEIAEKLGLKASQLSKRVKNLFINGLLIEYYNVFIDKLLKPSWIYIIEQKQRTSISKCFNTGNYPKPTVTYYSPIPRPTYIMYYLSHPGTSLGDEPLPFSIINVRKCRVSSYGLINNVVIPYEDYVNNKIYVLEKAINSNDYPSERIDYMDEYIAKTFFIASNPPITNHGTLDIVLKILMNENISKHVFRNHYYKHLRNTIIYKRILYRPYNREYAILEYVSVEPILMFEELINNFLNKGLIVGIDQIHIISYEPLILVAHIWVNPEKLWDPEVLVYETPNTYYNIWLVKQIV
jgi:hypothetical protein